MSRLRRQEGLMLIELLIAMAMMLIVFGATLTILQVVTNDQTATDERNQAQDRARLAMDQIGRQLRNIASPLTSPKLIERASSYEIVFQTVGPASLVSGSNTTGAERVRYCIPTDPSGSASNEQLYQQTQTWTTSSAPSTIPWSSSSCPDTAPSDGVSATGKYTVVPYIVNRYKGADRPAFYFNNGSAPSDLSTITSVQMDMFVNPTPSVSAAQAELKSGVYLRNEVQSPVAQFTSTPTGNGGVLLNGGISYSPDGGNLSYSWSCTFPSPCPKSSTLSGASDALVISWSPGIGTYTVQLTVTDSSGLTNTYSSQVTVT
jgi:type II secretory pathway pseudopilin PulG